jgi:hypothetical protein
MNASAAADAPLSREEEAFVERLALARLTHPGNRSARFATRAVVEALAPEQRDMLRQCCRSGAQERDSEVGCYLLEAANLRELGAFFDPLIRDYHHAPGAVLPRSGWQLDTDDGHGPCDLAAFGMAPVSMRVRVARNLETFPLPASMDRTERVHFETFMVDSLQALIEHPDYGGRIHSLTPESGPTAPNPNRITPTEHRALVASGAMFRDMDQDRFMKSAGIADDWPYGRACYVSRDGEVIVWIGEEDHLRLICMKTGTSLDEVFDRLHGLVSLIELMPGMTFAWDAQVGYLTSCPSNLGGGMRASLHATLPTLLHSGVDITARCAQVGLTVCGPGGDRTPIGADGVLELSPMRRAFMSERDIVRNLYDGVRQLVQPTMSP